MNETLDRTLRLPPGAKRPKTKRQVVQVPPKPLLLHATILSDQGEVNHAMDFDWSNLNQQWAFKVRMEDVLRQGFAVLLAPKRVDQEKLTALACQYPQHS